MTLEEARSLKEKLKKALARKTTYYPESKVPEYAIHDENSICGFFGPYRWLSNFWQCPSGIVYQGLTYPTTEHAYQAAKVPKADRSQFLTITTKEVKKLGHKVPKPHNWDDIKFDVMKELVYTKFQDMELRGKLFDTEFRHLEERNHWGDVYWGTNEKGVGQNNLGKILMEVRAKI